MSCDKHDWAEIAGWKAFITFPVSRHSTFSIGVEIAGGHPDVTRGTTDARIGA
jgi:hypothetical protein